MALVIFIGAVWLVLYHHAIYPIILRFVGRTTFSPQSGQASSPLLPTMTIVVPAHNEERVIAQKIANLAALTYPADRLQIIIALDGCTDATETIARETLLTLSPKCPVHVVAHATNLGKVAVLNEHIGRATSDIVVLSDTSASVDGDALMRVAAGFRSESTGVVCGSYAVFHTDHPGENIYWRYQTELKAGEAAVACPMGAHGAFYAVRRNLWTPLPPDTVNDDFVLPMTIVLGGSDAIYDRSIVARELDRSTEREGFWRRVRIGAGNVQQVVRLFRLADPRRPRIAFLFLSGKALRAAMPTVLIAMTISAFALALGNWAAIAVLASSLVTIGILALADGGAVPLTVPPKLRPLAYLAQGYAALTVGTLLCLVGSTGRSWKISRQARATRGRVAPSPAPHPISPNIS